MKEACGGGVRNSASEAKGCWCRDQRGLSEPGVEYRTKGSMSEVERTSALMGPKGSGMSGKRFSGGS